MNVRLLGRGEENRWDTYVQKHEKSTLCHFSGWRRIIENTYGHKSYYLIAENNETNKERNIVGVLPLIHIKSIFFGNTLVSMPFLNYGGVLANDDEAEKEILNYTLYLGKQLGVKCIELRCKNAISWQIEDNAGNKSSLTPRTNKVRMVRELSNSSDELFRSLSQRLRNKVRRPQKEGLKVAFGGIELLREFYCVFSINMRDLGSPVHSMILFQHVLKEFEKYARIAIVRHGHMPVAASLIMCFRKEIEMPWASALKKYDILMPNYLLYWSLLEYAANSGFDRFDFGRSTLDEGTYKFKAQWGAKPSTLYWYESALCDSDKAIQRTGYRFRNRGEKLWQAMPLFIANIIGPKIRKNIPL